MSSLDEIGRLIKKSFLLNEKEVLVYQACIGKKPLNPTQLSRLTGIKRTTIYLVLEELKKKGLIIENIKGKKRNINVSTPETLRHLVIEEQERIKEKSKMISNIIPLLENLQKIKGVETEVEILEGKSGAVIILEKILQQKKDIYWLGSLDTILQIIDEERLYRVFTWRRMDTKTTSYAISDRKILSNKKFGEKIEGFRQFRFLPESFKTPALVVLFGNSIGLVRVREMDLKIILVKDENIFEIMKFMFDTLWETLPKE